MCSPCATGSQWAAEGREGRAERAPCGVRVCGDEGSGLRVVAGSTSIVMPRHRGVGARGACGAVGATAVSRRARGGEGGGAGGGLGGAPHLRRRPSVTDRQQLALAASERPLNVAPGRACHRRSGIRSEAAGGRGERWAGRSEDAFWSRGKIGRCDTAAGRARAGRYAAGLNAGFQDRTACAVLWLCGARQGVHAGARGGQERAACGGGHTLI